MNVIVRSIYGEVLRFDIATVATFADLATSVHTLVGAQPTRKPQFVFRGEIQAWGTSLISAGLHDGCEVTLVWKLLQIPETLQFDLEGINTSLVHQLEQGETELSLDWEAIGNRGALTIAKTLQYSSLRTLSLTHYVTRPEDAGPIIHTIAEALPHCDLETLNFSDTDLGRRNGGFDVTLFKAILQSQCRLTTLNLHGAALMDIGAIAVAEALPECALTSLDISRNCIEADGACAIAGALPKSKLTVLILESNLILDNGVHAVANSLPHCLLKVLDLSYTRLSHKGLCSISQNLGTRLCKIEELRLCNNAYHSIRDAVSSLAKSLVTCSITALHLSGSQISDDGAQAIANVLPQSKLSRLALKSCDIGEIGICSVAQALPRASCLTSLDLSHNSFSQRSATDLATALLHCGLQELVLMSCLDGQSKEIITKAAATIQCQTNCLGTVRVRTQDQEEQESEEELDCDLFG